MVTFEDQLNALILQTFDLSQDMRTQYPNLTCGQDLLLTISYMEKARARLLAQQEIDGTSSLIRIAIDPSVDPHPSAWNSL